jgi:glucose/arabinose dehydrogenase
MLALRGFALSTLMISICGSLAWADQVPGSRYQVLPSDLPALGATESASNAPDLIPMPAGATVQVPEGFKANLFADGLGNPRNLAVGDNGDVFVVLSRRGEVALLRDSDEDGVADQRFTYARAFQNPFGIAIRSGFLYIADTDSVWRMPYRSGETSAAERTAITPEGAFGSGRGHRTRSLAFDPKGNRFYVAIGSQGNIGEEPAPRATVQEFRLDGSGQATFASGMRNPIGMAFHPDTGRLYAVVNERDGMGDGLVPDYLTAVQAGGFYGWPYSYIGSNPQPDFADRRPDLVKQAIVPDLLFESHSSPIGVTFYNGTQFPAEYRGDAFVALRGSWNSNRPVGYFVARVPFREGKPLGWYESFATGFWAGGTNRAQVWGRPAAVAVARDGSLLIADDTGGTLWRVVYTGR